MSPRTTTGFAFYVGRRDEPPVENAHFIECYLKYTAWLRSVSARQQIELIKTCKDQVLNRLAATANLYQQLAMQTEDSCAILIAMAALNRDQSKRLPDLLKRISFSANGKVREGYSEQCIKELVETEKTVRISAPDFFLDLATKRPIEMLSIIGLNWSTSPSMKTVPRYLRKFWDTLPNNFKTFCLSIGDTGTTNLSNAFNKIKHGPQIDVVNYYEYLRTLYASSESANENSVEDVIDTLRSNGNRPETLRILFDGANVAAIDQKVRPCLLLEDNPTDMLFFFHEYSFPSTVLVWSLVQFIRSQTNRAPHVAAFAEAVELVNEMRSAQVKSRELRAKRNGGSTHVH